MRFRHFPVTGVEVLHLGGQHWERNAWPADHWRQNKGRWRIHTPAIEDQVSSRIKDSHYGGNVQGIVIALEIADFAAWPVETFAKPEAAPSYKPSHKDLWCFAKLDWQRIKDMTLREQFSAYTDAVLYSIQKFELSKRKPKGFRASDFQRDLEAVLRSLKPSTLTLVASRRDA